MINIKRIVISIMIITMSVLTVAAEDIVFVTIKNNNQVEVVKNILDHAYTKVGERFLTSLNIEQAKLLSIAGAEYEIILQDVNVSSVYLIRPGNRRDFRLIDLNSLGETIDIGMGLKLANIDSFTASSLRDNTSIMVTPLEDLNIQFHYLPVTIPNYLVDIQDFPSDSLVNRVSQDSIYAFDTRLEAFQTRYIWTDSIDAARDWMVQKFLSWGYTDVTTPSFWWNGGWHYNVMAVKPGYAEPDVVIVIGGHYDSIVYGQEPGPLYFAPGADDNGSGTATTLELARIFADVPFRKTIIFMPFSAEEVGLVGSYYAAQDFVNNGTNIEVMFNFDMVGFTEDSYWDVNLMSGPNTAYRQVDIDAANRVTSLIPVSVGLSGSSDHWSFYEQGYNFVYAAEADFNTLGWHTNLDISSRMDFPYFTEVVKMSAASVAIIADAAHPTEIANIIDQGDGQSLEIFWSDCDASYNYSLYYGTSSGIYTDTVGISPGLCSYVVTGLTEGVTYYFSVIGDVEGGYPAIYSTEGSGVSYVVPRAPISLIANPDYQTIILDWDDNTEADLANYRIYRNDGFGYELYQNIITSYYEDMDVSGQVEYYYKVTAVDNDNNESDYSNEANSFAGTFDAGILLVDEISANPPIPPQQEQQDYFNNLFAGTSYTLELIDSIGDPLTLSQAAPFSSIFWFDDDLNVKMIEHSEEALDWYTDYQVNALIAGFRTLAFWSTSTIDPGHVLYRKFGLSSFSENNAFDFAGANGQNGWPSIEVDLSNILGYLPYIPKLTPRPGVTVIYTYDSYIDDPAYEGQPCGVLYDTPDGKRVVLAFPLYFLTEISAQQLMAYAISLFGEMEAYVYGDLDNSGEVDIADLVYFVSYSFGGGPPPANMNTADVDGSCTIDISDIVYLVNYMFGSPPGPAPVAGCYY